MPNSVRAVLALYVVVLVAACTPKAPDEVVYVDNPVVTVEPTYTGKYK